MNSIKYKKNALLAFLITLTNAISGGVLGIDGFEEWYPSLIKPISIPFWLFALVQPIYYLICIVILYRLFSYIDDRATKMVSTSLFIGMMIFAELWNYFFLGLHSVFLGFWLLIAFTIIVWMNYLILWRIDRFSFYSFTPYVLWLFVDLTWLYSLRAANS